jgi:hypothetical protein
MCGLESTFFLWKKRKGAVGRASSICVVQVCLRMKHTSARARWCASGRDWRHAPCEKSCKGRAAGAWGASSSVCSRKKSQKRITAFDIGWWCATGRDWRHGPCEKSPQGPRRWAFRAAMPVLARFRLRLNQFDVACLRHARRGGGGCGWAQ